MAESIISHRVPRGSCVHLVTAVGFADLGRLRRHRKGENIPLTTEGRAIFHRASERKEREYRIADRTDTEIPALRLERRIVPNLLGRVRS